MCTETELIPFYEHWHNVWVSIETALIQLSQKRHGGFQTVLQFPQQRNTCFIEDTFFRPPGNFISTLTNHWHKFLRILTCSYFASTKTVLIHFLWTLIDSLNALKHYGYFFRTLAQCLMRVRYNFINIETTVFWNWYNCWLELLQRFQDSNIMCDIITCFTGRNISPASRYMFFTRKYTLVCKDKLFQHWHQDRYIQLKN